MAVHRALGPGLLESAYVACLAFELASHGLAVEHQKPLPLVYRGVTMDCSYRMDLVVNGKVVIEVKAVDRFEPVHEAQLLSYLRLSGCRVGLLFNFHSKWLADHGIRRLVSDPPQNDSSRSVDESTQVR